MALSSRPCPVLVSYISPLSTVRESELLAELETKDDEAKIESLKFIISQQSQGDHNPKIMMALIKYCLNSPNHTIKKLLLLYWESVEKKTKEGAILSEMYLVCNAIKNNLIHPNEYIRGSTLRFLCKIREIEILESLIPSITANLEHRHSYVRKNSILTVLSIHECHPELIPDAADLIETFLYQETNPTCKRNAFVALYQCNPDKAVQYLSTIITSGPAGGSGASSASSALLSASESFQLSVLEVIRKVCRTTPAYKSQYIRAIYNLVLSTNAAVAFEGANTLISLSSAPTAVRAAVSAYTQLLLKESDNNVKLIILNRLSSLRKRNEKILQESLMDIMRALITPNTEIRKKILDLALSLLNPRLVDEVVQFLKKELERTQSPDQGTALKMNDSYRKLLVETLHQCAVKFTDVVPAVINILINFLGDEGAAPIPAQGTPASPPTSSPPSSSSSALDVVYFVREIVEEYEKLRESILQQVIDNFDEIKNSDVYRVVLWILGEYAIEGVSLESALSKLKQSIGPLPLLVVKPLTGEEAAEVKAKIDAEDDQKTGKIHHVGKEEKSAAPAPTVKKGPIILADGTYASQTAISAVEATKAAAASASSQSSSNISFLRGLLLNGDFFLAASVASTLTKLVLRFVQFVGVGTPEANEALAQAMLTLVCLLRVGTHGSAAKQIDPDSHQRILICIRSLMDPQVGESVFTTTRSRAVYSSLLTSTHAKEGPSPSATLTENSREVDDLIVIRQLKVRAVGQSDVDDELLEENEEEDIHKALASKNLHKDTAAKLNRVYQLTGFSDPVYAEAHMNVSDFDISLQILCINQTNTTLQNLSVELYTSGDLKIVERPHPATVAAHSVYRTHATIKMSSTESAIIFGNITFDNSSGTNKTICVMQNIHMDIMDYISPASCSDQQFRSMWLEFEWENKVAVNTDLNELNEYLHHILSITNMKLMTPDSTLSGSCNFLAANLYAKSMFGEDALLNLSVEKQKTGKITGFIRIRSKTQGIALSLGDKITSKQRGLKAA